MKRLILVHAWGENPESCWYQWYKKQLETRGVEVATPAMPNTDRPEIEAWVGVLKGLVTQPNEEIFLIGHSIGSQTILRYLESLSAGQQVGGVLFVAPWARVVDLEEESVQIARPWLETPIDWQAVKSHSSTFIAFFSDNDPWVPLEEAKLFQKELGAVTTVLHNAGHFDQRADFPELLHKTLELMET